MLYAYSIYRSLARGQTFRELKSRPWRCAAGAGSDFAVQNGMLVFNQCRYRTARKSTQATELSWITGPFFSPWPRRLGGSPLAPTVGERLTACDQQCHQHDQVLRFERNLQIIGAFHEYIRYLRIANMLVRVSSHNGGYLREAICRDVRIR